MSAQPLRGSKAGSMEAIAATLEVALSSAKDEAELRRFVQVVINGCRKKQQPKKRRKA